MEIEDIIGYSIMAIFALVVIGGAVLLRRRFVYFKKKKANQLEQEKLLAKQSQDLELQRLLCHNRLLNQARSEKAVQLQERAERERIKGMQNVTSPYQNLGNAGEQRFDPKTGTIQTAVYDNITNEMQWRPLGGTGGTTSAQPVPVQSSNRTSDMFTGIAIGSLMSNLFGTSQAKSNTDFGWDDSDSKKSSSSNWDSSSSSDSSSSWSDSSDSGPSSDW